MNKSIDTNLEIKQQNLALLIATTGKALGAFQNWEDENILPLIQAQDRQAFLDKHTKEYKVRLFKLLQTIFCRLPLWELPLAKWAIAEVRILIQELSKNLSQEKES